jgi:hypothetical protein
MTSTPLKTALLITFLFCIHHKSIAQSIQLNVEQTQQYSHVTWSKDGGIPIPIKLYPLAIQTLDQDRNIHDRSDLKPHNIEKRTASSPLNHMLYQLINQNQQLDPDSIQPQYRLLVQLTEYQPLYAVDGDSFVSRFNEDMLELFSFMLDNVLETKIALNFHLYPLNSNRPLYQFTVSTSLDQCSSPAQTTLFFGNDFTASKMNALSRSTIGKTYIAAVNRGLQQVMHYLSNQHILGRIEQIDFNQVYLTFNNENIVAGQTVSVINNSMPGSKRPHQMQSFGQLKIAETYNGYSIAYPIDVKLGNLMVGDHVLLKTARSWKPIMTSKSASKCTDDGSSLDFFRQLFSDEE